MDVSVDRSRASGAAAGTLATTLIATLTCTLQSPGAVRYLQE
jgi:hypothetical protein